VARGVFAVGEEDDDAPGGDGRWCARSLPIREALAGKIDGVVESGRVTGVDAIEALIDAPRVAGEGDSSST
jgi:hypothetical protein